MSSFLDKIYGSFFILFIFYILYIFSKKITINKIRQWCLYNDIKICEFAKKSYRMGNPTEIFADVVKNNEKYHCKFQVYYFPTVFPKSSMDIFGVVKIILEEKVAGELPL